MLSKMKFTEGMNKLGDVFPSVKLPARLNRYWLTVNFLSDAEFSQIIDGFLDGAIHAPRPIDFKEAVAALKRAEFTKFEDSADPRNGDGLESFLRQTGVTNILDAVERFRASAK